MWKVYEERGLGYVILLKMTYPIIHQNKFKGIRAANVVDVETAKQSVEHNDINVLCLGSKNVNEKNAMDIIEIFLETEFIQKEKYIRRVSKLEH